MIQRSVTIINKLGLHARAAAKFVALAGTFACDIKLVKNTTEVNGKSILGVMMLAAAQGTELEIVVNGEDESVALEALEQLIERRFDEDE